MATATSATPFASGSVTRMTRCATAGLLPDVGTCPPPGLSSPKRMAEALARRTNTPVALPGGILNRGECGDRREKNLDPSVMAKHLACGNRMLLTIFAVG